MKTTLTVDRSLAFNLNLISYFLAFSVPIFLPHPQWLTGSVVNALLFLAVLKFPLKDIYPLLILPSLGAVTQGILFGPQTIFLYYFLPFIWLGNYVLVMVFKTTAKQPLALSVGLAAITKYLTLSLAASLYFRFELVPVMFLTAMGSTQLFTALTGGLLAYVINPLLKSDERS